MSAAAYPKARKVLTFRDVGEIVSAEYSGKKSAHFRVEAGGLPLGRFDGDGGSWNNEYSFLKKSSPASPGALLYLTSARPSKVTNGTLILKTARGKTFRFQVPGFKGDYNKKEHRLLDGTKMPEGRLYLGSDGKVYLDNQAKRPAR